MERYVEVYDLDNVLDGETVVAFHEGMPYRNYEFEKKNMERAAAALKEAANGECRLLVWREVPKGMSCVASGISIANHLHHKSHSQGDENEEVSKKRYRMDVGGQK